jgi:hypothetical protein
MRSKLSEDRILLLYHDSCRNPEPRILQVEGFTFETLRLEGSEEIVLGVEEIEPDQRALAMITLNGLLIVRRRKNANYKEVKLLLKEKNVQVVKHLEGTKLVV